MTTRRTRQLAAVEAVVSAAHDHPSADDVHRRVRRTLPRVSLGTVYRNLQKLASSRQLRVLQIAGRGARYDGMVAAHDHFLCESCGTLTDVVLRQRPVAVRRRAGLGAGYLVKSETVTFYGLCPQCAVRSPAPSRRGSGRGAAGDGRGGAP